MFVCSMNFIFYIYFIYNIIYILFILIIYFVIFYVCFISDRLNRRTEFGLIVNYHAYILMQCIIINNFIYGDKII